MVHGFRHVSLGMTHDLGDLVICSEQRDLFGGGVERHAVEPKFGLGSVVVEGRIGLRKPCGLDMNGRVNG